MDAGKLNERIEILKLTAINRDSLPGYEWQPECQIWAKADEPSKSNIFSKVGISARSAHFIVRRLNLSLFNAIRWKGHFCFLSAVTSIDRRYLDISAAQVSPIECALYRTKDAEDKYHITQLDDSPAPVLFFPGVLTEKYLGSAEEKARYEQTLRYVLVAPKAVELHEGELVEADTKKYRVMLCHDLDEYKNEYEIERAEDEE